MSAIFGDGYGSSHDWEYLGSNDSRVSLYACRNCHAHFYHAYDRIPDIFDAMKRENVADECPNRSPDDATPPPMQKVDLDKLDAAFAANNRDWWFNAEPINDAYPALAEELRALRVLRAPREALSDPKIKERLIQVRRVFP